MKASRRFLSVLLAIVMTVMVLSPGLSGIVLRASATETIQYGTYPQSRVTDSDLIAELNASDVPWKSYGYFSGNGSPTNGKMTAQDYMQYRDVKLNKKMYRGVYFTQYRPRYTGVSTTEANSYQDDNGYTVNTPETSYWFEFEPLQWRVLNENTGLILCETAIDAQAYNNYVISSSSVYYSDAEMTHYANDYYNSSIRYWLNHDFYNTAFTSDQKDNILKTTLNNNAVSTDYSEFDSHSSSDKVFLLSWSDVTNASYGFSALDTDTDAMRIAEGTDYAKCQGISVYGSSSSDIHPVIWWLRSPASTSVRAARVGSDGSCTITNGQVYNAYYGIRPAICLDDLKSDITQNYPTSVYFGSYPQTRVTDSDLISALNAEEKEWISYGYYSGTGYVHDGQMTAGDYMKYCDVVYNGNKYRGVYFTAYRPSYTGYETVAEKSYQDDNGYTTNTEDTAYWFRYDQLSWRVLDREEGLIMCESIIDSQAFSNYIEQVNIYTMDPVATFFGSSSHKYYSSDYSQSSIRQWLINDFYNTAFTEDDKIQIMASRQNNDAQPKNTSFDSSETYDSIFLLSYNEVIGHYDFYPRANEHDEARFAQGTDYAKCQGLYVSKSADYLNNSSWRLRTPGSHSGVTPYVESAGTVTIESSVGCTYLGVRPVLRCRLALPQPNRTIQFGNYPQSRVTDSELIEELTANATDWISYDYFSGTNSDTPDFDGLMTAKSFMKYCDVVCYGVKYRGVYFTNYRPSATNFQSSAANSNQDDNGYTTNTAETAYWFRYEPLTWQVLDEDTGLLMCDSIIDAQAYNNYVKLRYGSYYGDADYTYYANDYYNSSIRQWLNDDFYNTAFSSSQKSKIVTTTLTDVQNPFTQTGQEQSDDNIFLLTSHDILNTNYNFSSDAAYDMCRVATGTDYAKCQGLEVTQSNHYGHSASPWRLRTPDNEDSKLSYMVDAGGYRTLGNVDNTGAGIRPVCRVSVVEQDTTIEMEKSYVKFGTYPQTKVTDSAVIAALNASNAAWKSYRYYTGTDSISDGQMTASDYMFYRDAVLDGVKYRGVYFTSYRPTNTGKTSSAANSYQDNRSYTVNSPETAYWFKYEPLNWRILDYDTGLVMCENLIDAQDYNSFVISANGEFYGDSKKTYFANDYFNSSLRKWLNDEFYNTAFNDEQKANILSTVLDNDAYPSDYSAYDSASCTDKIFVLSMQEVTNPNYGFLGNSDRTSAHTDYACCQGLGFVTGRTGFSWWLRSPNKSGYACAIGVAGETSGRGTSGEVNWSYIGIRPAMRLKKVRSNTEQNIPASVQFGTYPQSRVTDSELISALNAEEHIWISYNYYSGTGERMDGQMTAGDFMKYCDVVYNGEKYRGVYFTDYRPDSTGQERSASNSSQDYHGYTVNTAETPYWFKYEPITWRVLDPDTGMIMCDMLIDAQPFNSFLQEDEGECYNSRLLYAYASDYYYSTIRHWLISDFYDTAFTAGQKDKILTTTVAADSLNPYTLSSSRDKVFLLSTDEATNYAYGFLSANSSDGARWLPGTDYAKAQDLLTTAGLTSGDVPVGGWWLRDAGSVSSKASGVYYDGQVKEMRAGYAAYGVAPAMCLSGLYSDTDVNLDQRFIQYGNYPQSRVTDSDLLSELNASDVPWTSYNYYSGNGSISAETTTAKDFMQYRDVELDGVKYRGVYFTEYRPNRTESTSDASHSYQDDNNYVPNTPETAYWFRYEPLLWRVLDKDTGLVMCETAIDAQPINNVLTYDDISQTYGSLNGGVANDYSQSDMRKWLTGTFYKTAFSSSQKNNIVASDLDIVPYQNSSTFTYQSCTDKVYLLSYEELTDTDYGFVSSHSDYDAVRHAQGSDYAKCQGLDSEFLWWERTPHNSSLNMLAVVSDTGTCAYPLASDAVEGVRPAIRLEVIRSDTSYDVKHTIQYGSYPQSRVTDSSLITALNGIYSPWKSYRYYSGDMEVADGNMTAGDYMKYRDVSYNGDKYRAVYFTDYRPYATGFSNSDEATLQVDNGYTLNTEQNPYWFKFEPLTWRVLDEDTGLVLCENSIDSQAYNSYILRSGNEYYGDSNESYYANNYENSSIRKWLNEDFYNTAFTLRQKSNISATELDNYALETAYSSSYTTDKIFLLSRDDVTNGNYGFETDPQSEDTARCSGTTEYAKCQGIAVSDPEMLSFWWLRTAAYDSITACAVEYSGMINGDNGIADAQVCLTLVGVRPAMCLTTVYDDTFITAAGRYVQYGNYPRSRVTDSSLIAALNADTSSEWVSYGYYSGEGVSYNGSMTHGDFMKYRDVELNGDKYRGVLINDYRPDITDERPGYSPEGQVANGYELNTVYWFKYEPISWRVLDPDTGMILCEDVLDSQPYNNYVQSTIKNNKVYYYGDEDETNLANDYYYSSLRQWLNDDFYNTAFTSAQKDNILTTELADIKSGSEKANDKVFLLSKLNATSSYYGFATDTDTKDHARRVLGTDYAKCQGLIVDESSNAEWWTRTSSSPSSTYDGQTAYRVYSNGKIIDNTAVNNTYLGVRPAITLDEIISNTELFEEAFSEYTDIAPGETKDADVVDGEMAYFRFIPTESGIYSFSSATDNYDTLVYLYDARGNQIATDDDGGDGVNFKLTANCTAGKTYYFGCSMYGGSVSASYPVTLSQKITFADAGDIFLHDHLDENVAGGTEMRYTYVPEQSGTYYFYIISTDQNQLTGSSAFLYDTSDKCLVSDSTSGYNGLFKIEYDFVAGQTYYFDVSVNGYEDSQYNVTIVLEDEFLDVIPFPGSDTVVDQTTGYIYGLTPGEDDLLNCVLIADVDNCLVDIGFTEFAPDSVWTGFNITHGDDTGSPAGKTYTFIIFGDVDGNGWYDGMDAFIVYLYVNGLLSDADMGDVRLFAADVNHDGLINDTDVDILEQAGILLAQVQQTESGTEQHSGGNLKYLSLIDQTPDATEEEPVEEPVETEPQSPLKTFIQKLVDFIQKILLFLRSLFPKV